MPMTEADVWRAAREDALARLEEAYDAQLTQIALHGTTEELVAFESTCEHQRKQLMSPDWLSARPPRRMRAAKKIAEYWEGRETFFVDLNDPRCFGCFRRVAAWSELERAHLVDRFLGGLDLESNLAMICHSCHRVMPMFEIDEGQEAINWVLSRLNSDFLP